MAPVWCINGARMGMIKEDKAPVKVPRDKKVVKRGFLRVIYL